MAATAVNTQLTLLELAKRVGPDGNLLTIAEVLHESNEMMQDIPMIEANGLTSHKEVRRASLPTGTWRRFNQGVAREASQTTPIEEPMGILESFSVPDKKLVDISPNPKGKRMQEAVAFLEGMGQNYANKMLYGDNGLNPEQFTGLAPRLDVLQTGAKRLVIGAGGSGSDTTSMFVVQWGIDTVFGIFPKNSPTMGVEHTDMGVDVVLDGSNNEYLAYRDHFELNGGLCVKDPRALLRIANIETSGVSNIFDEDLLIEGLNNMKNAGKGAVIYVDRILKTQMEIALKDKANVNFTVDNGLGGVPVLHFRGHPIRLVEQISTTEVAIT